jgi:hypothetical protein
MPIKLKNNVSGFLATAISASDTGLVLQSGNGAAFPTLGASDYFYATLVSTGGTQEVVKVTARVGDTMTVVRAQEGSSAAGFAAGTRMELRVTAQSVLDATRYSEIVSVKDFGAVGDGVADDTVAIQAAITAAAVNGGTVFFPAGKFNHSGITLPSRVFLQGAGRLSTTLYLIDGSNTNSIFIPKSSDVIGWSGFTVHGNSQNNTTGHGIEFEAALSGGNFAAESIWAAGAERAYKHCVAYDFSVGYAAEHGIYLKTRNFKVFMDNFTVVRAGLDGVLVECSDGIFSNFYIERNRRAGLNAGGSNNKYVNGKVIWSGSGNNTLANIYVQGGDHKFVAVEAQDGYCDGFSVGGVRHSFVGCASNRNGYSAEGAEGVSSRIHTDLRIRTSSVGTKIDMRVYTYATTVGTDGFWTTEWPYYFDGFSQGQIDFFNVKYDATTYNTAPPTYAFAAVVNNITNISGQKTGTGDVLNDISPIAQGGVGNQIIRLFRSSVAGLAARLDIHIPGTTTINHQLTSSAAVLCNSVGDTIIGNGGWDGRRLRLGVYFLWVDASGRLRIKDSTPTSDTDGTIVGTQS